MSFIDEQIKKYGRKNLFLIIAGVFIIIGTLESMALNSMKMNFSVQGIHFNFKGEDNGIWTYADEQSGLLTAYIDQQSEQNLYDYPTVIEYRGDVITRKEDIEKAEHKIYLNDQLIYTEYLLALVTHADSEFEENNQQNEKEAFAVALTHKLIKSYEYIQTETFIWMILFCSFFSVLGAALITFPEVNWKLKHSLYVEGGEPSNYFIEMTQISGAVITFVGLIFPIVIAFNA